MAEAINIQNLVSKKNIACRYGVATRTINDWMRYRIIPYYKIRNKTVRFDPVKCDIALTYCEQSARCDSYIQEELKRKNFI